MEAISNNVHNPVQESHGSIRDSKSENCLNSANEAYDAYLSEYHPEYESKVYRIPFTTLFHCNAGKPVKLNHDTFKIMASERHHVLGDNAEKKAADSFERMLKKACHPAFIITNYDFKQFCSEKDNPPPDDKNVFLEEGEHDIVIISFHYGIFFIQVKAVQEGSDLTVAWDKAKDQLEKDKKFINMNFTDVQQSVTTKTVIAFPNIDTKTLKRVYTTMYEDHIIKYEEEGLLECLLDDHLSGIEEDKGKEKKLEEWWNQSTTDSHGFESMDDYKKVIARYIGRKSTVIFRSRGTAVAGMGNRYMNILLTPQQVAILTSGIQKLIIRGQYGSGKTILLILKMRQMLSQPVCIITMSNSPLKHVIAAAVQNDMEPVYSNNLSVTSVSDHEELKTELERCKELGCHVFIDEVPSDLKENDSLSEVIKTYPTERFFWAVMSSERGEHLSANLQRIFSVQDEDYPELSRFKEAVLNKVLRCPPSIFPRPKHDICIRTTFKRNNENVLALFLDLGLSTLQMSLSDDLHQLSLSDSIKYKWSDIIVVDACTIKSGLLEMINSACVPYSHAKTMGDVTRDRFLYMEKLAKTTKTALYTDSIPIDCLGSRKLVASLPEAQIYVEAAFKQGPVTEIKTQDEFEEVLQRYKLNTHKLKERAEERKQQQQKQQEKQVEFKKWEDNLKQEKRDAKRKGDELHQQELKKEWEKLIQDKREWKQDARKLQKSVLSKDATDVLPKLTFVSKPELYLFLKKLEVPLVTPSDFGSGMTKDAVLYTDDENMEGFQDSRKIVLRVINETVLVNQEVRSTEGLRPVLLDHTKHDANTLVETCEDCQTVLNNILTDLGLQILHSQPADEDEDEDEDEDHLQRNIISQHKKPKRKLHWSDVVVLDDRSKPSRDVAGMLQKLIPVEEKLESGLYHGMHAFGYQHKVLYTTPENFKGLERKVVLVVVDMDDNSDLARSRCSSQLILLKTNSVDE